jgi:rhodanese-related sulfurtransferase
MQIQAFSTHPEGFRELSPTQAEPVFCHLRVIDVRQPEEYNGSLGHLPGAELVPLSALTEAARGWDRQQPVLLVCRSGARGVAAARALTELGFTSLYNLAGGMLAWSEARLPVAHGAEGSLSTLREEVFGCFVAMNGGEASRVEPMFRQIFSQVNARYEAPSPEEMGRVLEALKSAALAAGRSEEELAPHFDHFKAQLRRV